MPEQHKPIRYDAAFSGKQKFFLAAGPAGIMCLLFGPTIWLLYSAQNNMIHQLNANLNELSHARAVEIKELRDEAEKRFERIQDRQDKMLDREDKYRERMWAYLAQMSWNIKTIMKYLNISSVEEMPLPKKSNK